MFSGYVIGGSEMISDTLLYRDLSINPLGSEPRG
jgi:hypothetical protein